MKKVIFLIAVSLFMVQEMSAQNPLKGKYRRFSIDVSGGVPMIYGDIKNKFVGYDFAARVNWNATSAVSIGAEVGYGYVKGYESTTEFFTNRYTKVLVGGEVYLFDLFKMNQLSNWFQPYAGMSVGAIKSDIEKSQSDNHFNDWAWANQFTGGLKFKLTNMIDLNLNANFVLTGTDKLDNYNPQVFNNKNVDALAAYKLGLTFHLGKKANKSIIWKNENEATLVKKDDSLELYTQYRMYELERKVLALEKQNRDINSIVVSSKKEVTTIGDKLEIVEKKTLDIEKQVESSLQTTIYYQSSGDEVPSSEKSKLMDVFKYIAVKPNAKVVVSGYTDKVGDEQSNLKLSLKRAEKVKQQLVNLGIDANRIETYGYGENNLLPFSDLGNRRVIITVK